MKVTRRGRQVLIAVRDHGNPTWNPATGRSRGTRVRGGALKHLIIRLQREGLIKHQPGIGPSAAWALTDAGVDTLAGKAE